MNHYVCKSLCGFSSYGMTKIGRERIVWYLDGSSQQCEELLSQMSLS